MLTLRSNEGPAGSKRRRVDGAINPGGTVGIENHYGRWRARLRIDGSQQITVGISNGKADEPGSLLEAQRIHDSAAHYVASRCGICYKLLMGLIVISQDLFLSSNVFLFIIIS